MILGVARDWLFNAMFDSINRIFINIIDSMIYMLIAIAYKVFLLISSFDLFSSYNTGTENTHAIYTELTDRIYSVLAIVVLFILAYQIIIFVIDPDKGMKQTKQLVVNFVKAMIMVILAPLLFHYMSLIQYHVLITDNVIWRLVLGEGGSQASNVSEGGNVMTNMLFMSVYHPTGTQYSDFYDDDGKLRSYDEACSSYKGGNMSKDTIAAVVAGAGAGGAGGALVGAGFMGVGALPAGIAGAIVGGGGAFIGTLMQGETTACQFYYRQLYIADPSVTADELDIAANEMNSVSNYGTRKSGSTNKVFTLAASPALSDEIFKEGNMEYSYFSPVAGGIILYLLVAYILDIAYRAFKLAFLQIIAPVPILLGVVPKNEKMYSKWKDSLLKTYVDIFVRVFVMAFIMLLIKLLPKFVDAMYSAYSTANADSDVSVLLKVITFFALVIGLLRFGKELPDLIKDFAKNGSGLLSGIDLDPKNSFKKSREAVEWGRDTLGKPLGAAAGAVAGSISAKHAIADKGGKGVTGAFNRSLAGLRGLQIGGQQGWQNGLKRGSITNAMVHANDRASHDLDERSKRFEQLRKGQIPAMLEEMSQDRIKNFKSAWGGDILGLEDSFLYKAGSAYQENATGAKSFFSSAGDGVKNKITPQVDHALSNVVAYTDENGFNVFQYQDASNKEFKYQGTTVDEVRKNAYEMAKNSGSAENGYTFNGNTFKGDNALKDLENSINQSITNDSLDKLVSTNFRGKMYSGTYSEVEKQLNKVKDQLVKEKEIETFSESLDADNIRKFARSASALDAQYFDTIGERLQKHISDKSNECLSARSEEFKKMLLDANGGREVNYSNSRSVMDIISNDKFMERYNEMTEDSRKAINNDIAEYFHTITNAEDKVSKEIAKTKSAANGAKINRATGVTENVLSKKDK